MRAIGTPKPMAVEITGPRAPKKIINGSCRIALTKTPIAKTQDFYKQINTSIAK